MLYLEPFNCYGQDYYDDYYDFGRVADSYSDAVRCFTKYLPEDKAKSFVDQAWAEGYAEMTLMNRFVIRCERATGRHLTTAGDWWRRMY